MNLHLMIHYMCLLSCATLPRSAEHKTHIHWWPEGQLYSSIQGSTVHSQGGRKYIDKTILLFSLLALHSSGQSRYFCLFHCVCQLYDVVTASKLRTLMVNVNILAFNQLANGKTELEFEILLPRPYTPDKQMVKDELLEGIRTFQLPNRDLRLGQTDIILGRTEINDLKIIGMDFVLNSPSQ